MPAPAREVATLKDVTLLVVDYDEALAEANSKIEAIGVIVDEFGRRIEGPR